MKKLSFEIPRTEKRIISRAFTLEMFNELCSLTPHVLDSTRKSISERVYCLENNITEYPKCQICSSEIKFRNKYAKTCSKSCTWKLVKKNERNKTTQFSFENCFINGVLRTQLSDGEFNELVKLTSFIPGKSRSTIQMRAYCLKNNIIEIPKCKECTNDVNWQEGAKYFGKFCSRKCSTEYLKKNSKAPGTDLFFKREIKLLDVQSNFIPRCYNGKNVNGRLMTEEIKNKVKLLTPFLDFKDATMSERIFCIDNKIGENPKCWCGNNLTFSKSNGFHYSQFCSNKCSKRAFYITTGKIGEDYPGSVYILYFNEHKAVKIGLSTDVNSRFQELKRDFGNFEIIQLIETEACKTLEFELHERFSEYRLCLEEGSGRTEFFKEEILKLI